MKAIKYVSMAAIALAMTACSNDENEVTDNWNGEIRLSSGVSVQTRANSTDVPDKQIASTELIGIYVSKANDETATYAGYDNVKAEADGYGNFSDYSYAMYYPQSGKGVNISAYHPFKVEEGKEYDEYDFIVEYNQAVPENYYKSDLLYSAKTLFPRSKDPNSLTFKHKLSKITCTLTADDGITATLSDATVEVVNPERAVRFNRTTGIVTDVDNTASVKANVTVGTYGAIIAPQTISSGSQLLKITLSTKDGGGVFYYKTDAEIKFESGYVYNYTITVKASGLEVSSTIDTWTAIAKTGDAVME